MPPTSSARALPGPSADLSRAWNVMEMKLRKTQIPLGSPDGSLAPGTPALGKGPDGASPPRPLRLLCAHGSAPARELHAGRRGLFKAVT